MTHKSNYISQVQDQEKNAAKRLKDIEAENNKRVDEASEKADIVVREIEEVARTEARGYLDQAKEKAKAEYKHILEASSTELHQVVESGKKNISQAKKHVQEAFDAIFG